MSELCEKRIPEFGDRLTAAIASLEPWTSSAGRQPASDGRGELEKPDRESWARWSEECLVEYQRYLDGMSGSYRNPALQEALSGVADLLVAFHGYASGGQAAKMVRTLERIRARADEARELACGRTAVASRAPASRQAQGEPIATSKP